MAVARDRLQLIRLEVPLHLPVQSVHAQRVAIVTHRSLCVTTAWAVGVRENVGNSSRNRKKSRFLDFEET